MEPVIKEAMSIDEVAIRNEVLSKSNWKEGLAKAFSEMESIIATYSYL